MRASRVEALSDGTGYRVELSDGRFLGMAEYGDPAGSPLLWFPGTPGSRLAAPPDEQATRAAGIRFIVLERPGFGVSTALAKRRVLDWPADVAQVVDLLGLQWFALGGASGAGPYVYACALRLGSRVRCATLCGAIGPVSEPALASEFPWRRRVLLQFVRRAPSLARRVALRRGYAKDPACLLRDLTAGAPSCDRVVLTRIWERQLRMTREALRQGSDAFCWELHLGASPWGFQLAEIDVPVLLWHGARDIAAPVAIARHVAGQLRRGQLHCFPEEGHFLHFDRWPEILASVISHC